MDIENICTTYVVHKDCHTRFLDDIHTHDIRKGDLIHGGISDMRTAFEIDRPEPYYHCVIYTLEGRGVFYAAEGKLNMSPGQCLVAPASVRHHYKMVGKRWKFFFFLLRDVFLWKPVLKREVSVRTSPSIRELEYAMEGYLAESDRQEHDSERATHLYAALIEIFLRRDLDMDENPKALRLRYELYALWDKVASDPAHDWSVSDLAAELHMSTACFYRVCAKYAGVKPMGMVTSLRMRKAEQLLRLTDHPIKVIADMVGYSSAFSFSEAFHRHCGLSPREFRKTNKP